MFYFDIIQISFIFEDNLKGLKGLIINSGFEILGGS